MPCTKAKAKVVKALRVAKAEELSRAVKYCQDKNVHGYSAVKTGLFPSIKDARTINKQLDEPKSTTKSKRSDCKILSDMEEQALVRFLKNKSCSVQGATHAEATKYIHDILRVRDHLDKQCKGGWEYRLISENRECVTIKPCVSFDGEILMCHVIFPGTCINGHMAPKTAVEKINNLLVATTDSGY